MSKRQKEISREVEQIDISIERANAVRNDPLVLELSRKRATLFRELEQLEQKGTAHDAENSGRADD